jgi:hypothetical protein
MFWHLGHHRFAANITAEQVMHCLLRQDSRTLAFFAKAGHKAHVEVPRIWSAARDRSNIQSQQLASIVLRSPSLIHAPLTAMTQAFVWESLRLQVSDFDVSYYEAREDYAPSHVAMAELVRNLFSVNLTCTLLVEIFTHEQIKDLESVFCQKRRARNQGLLHFVSSGR